jgi:hypothetical protein
MMTRSRSSAVVLGLRSPGGAGHGVVDGKMEVDGGDGGWKNQQPGPLILRKSQGAGQ